ncbi:MAG: Hsp20/alpha crystallin family protein, partial [Rhodocyclaceae bacterium]|nr:Hsp20/alpha crystallin family protein [Rhodocyclaceae bacterium]
MNLIKWNPFSELEDISSRLNQIFGRSAASATAGHEMMKVADWAPSVDISETDQAFLIKAEI